MTFRSARAALRRRVGRRGAALLAFALIDILYAGSMLTASDSGLPLNATYQWFGELMPLAAWAAVWALVAAVCTWSALHHYDRAGFVAAIGIKVVWSLLSLAGWVLDDVTLGSVGIWLGLAVVVGVIAGWAEPPLLDEAPTGEDDRHAL